MEGAIMFAYYSPVMARACPGVTWLANTTPIANAKEVRTVGVNAHLGVSLATQLKW